MSADGEFGIVGTANMDIRSFRLNFEVCMVCYSEDVACGLDRHFEEDVAHAKEVLPGDFIRRPRAEKFIENSARLMSALL